MAVVYLNHPPRGVSPASLAQFEESMLGESFELVGYGVNESGQTGTKYAGPVSARALAGTWYQLLFPDFETYLDWYLTDSVSNHTVEEATAWWDAFTLEPGYELLAGGLEGEVVGCSGDSGGPLLRATSPDDATVYGVNFAGELSLKNYCDHGSGIEVLNEEMLAFVEAAVAAGH